MLFLSAFFAGFAEGGVMSTDEQEQEREGIFSEVVVGKKKIAGRLGRGFSKQARRIRGILSGNGGRRYVVCRRVTACFVPLERLWAKKKPSFGEAGKSRVQARRQSFSPKLRIQPVISSSAPFSYGFADSTPLRNPVIDFPGRGNSPRLVK